MPSITLQEDYRRERASTPGRGGSAVGKKHDQSKRTNRERDEKAMELAVSPRPWSLDGAGRLIDAAGGIVAVMGDADTPWSLQDRRNALAILAAINRGKTYRSVNQ